MQSPSENPSLPARWPYVSPRVDSRDLFERAALVCTDPDTGEPIEGGPS